MCVCLECTVVMIPGKCIVVMVPGECTVVMVPGECSSSCFSGCFAYLSCDLGSSLIKPALLRWVRVGKMG